ncbi:MAG: L-threonylcarbamoyladenylate synthase [Flavobacteriales bacterium]|jgi:L-threonylcarbamoyladenylate synthase|tara:strand:+ start:476 stop:1018 length:543 start_codon:yes stop_codon:yes gene_type:complete
MILEIEKALNCLNKGGILIYPSDTIWAIGCDATNLKAINKIFKIKNRNRSNPFICLMDDFKMSDRYVKTTNKIKSYLKKNNYPITVIYNDVKNLETFPKSIAVRIPKDEFCIKLIKKFNKPIISTSVNISGEYFPLFFNDIKKEILDQVDYKVNLRLNEKLDKPSAIIKVEGGTIITLRP